ncbi:9416_t:CDS:2, partial [Acaulospora morrowiae]
MASDVESFDEGKMSSCEIALKTRKQKRTKRNEPEIDNGCLNKLKHSGLTWRNKFEILALSSIIIFDHVCPYPSVFTLKEWQMITEQNPVVPENVSTA